MGKEQKMTRDEQRAAAREKARQANEARIRKEKLRKISIQLGSILAGVLVLGLVMLMIFQFNKPPVPQANPANMISNGAVLTKGMTLVPSNAIPVGGSAVYPEDKADKVSIIVYVDYLCPACKAFEEATEDFIEELVATGNVTVEYRPVAFLSLYSAVASNASACVASNEPDKWWLANMTLYKGQPEERLGQQLTKQQSIKTIQDLFVPLDLSNETKQCVKETPYFDWAQTASNESTNGPVPNTNGAIVSGTPTIIVDGEQFKGSGWGELVSVVDDALAAKNLK